MIEQDDSVEIRQAAFDEYVPKFEKLVEVADAKNKPLLIGLIKFNCEKMSRAATAKRIKEIGDFVLNSAKAIIGDNIVAIG